MRMCPQCAPPSCMSRSNAGQWPVRGVCRPVGRVLCARSRGAAVIHLGLPLPAASCGLPASIGRAALDRSRREPLVPLLTLLRVGFTKPPQSPAALVVSYTTVSPLPRRPGRGARRFAFCGTVPRVTPGRRYRPPCPVEPGPSSPGRSPARPPGRLTRDLGYAGRAPAAKVPSRGSPSRSRRPPWRLAARARPSHGAGRMPGPRRHRRTGAPGAGSGSRSRRPRSGPRAARPR